MSKLEYDDDVAVSSNVAVVEISETVFVVVVTELDVVAWPVVEWTDFVIVDLLLVLLPFLFVL